MSPAVPPLLYQAKVTISPVFRLTIVSSLAKLAKYQSRVHEPLALIVSLAIGVWMAVADRE